MESFKDKTHVGKLDFQKTIIVSKQGKKVTGFVNIIYLKKLNWLEP